MDKKTEVPAPEFEQYERVNLSWNGERVTKVVSRWYEYDKDQWWYKVSNDEQFYPEGAFSHFIE